MAQKTISRSSVGLERRSVKPNVLGSSPSGRAKIKFKVEYFSYGGENETSTGGQFNLAKDVPWYKATAYTDYVIDGVRVRVELGDAVLILTKYGFWETHIAVWRREDRGIGLGIKLYTKLFQTAKRKRLRVCSSSNPSDDAILLWKSKRLRSKFTIRKMKRRYYLTSKT